MARVISSLVVVGLLGASAAAFALTEGLKLERSPITGTRITTAFSPDCGCATRSARISFRLRRPDSVTAVVLGPGGSVVQTIVSGFGASRGFLTLHWDGRDAAGTVVPQGAYRVRVHLARRRQTITLPNKILVDMKRPKIVIARLRPRLFSPDSDGRRDRVAIRFRVSEVARPLLLVNGRRAIRGRLTHGSGVLYWAGRVNGRTLPAGRYALTLRARDVAGNRSAPSRPHVVEIRYVAVEAPRVVRVPSARLFLVPVASDARRVEWKLGGRSGFVRPGKVHLRAPKRPGRYRLVFTERGHRVSMRVIVRRKP